MWRLRHLKRHNSHFNRSLLLRTSPLVTELSAHCGSCKPQQSLSPPLRDQIITRHFAGRKDRASTAYEVRPPTKKQRKAYHKRRREQQYEATKHSKPGSKAIPRRLEDKETEKQLLEIALEEEQLKQRLVVYFDKVNELQSKIESSEKFTSLLRKGEITQHELKQAAREAAKKAAEKQGVTHPPLPSWWQERMTYDFGDALIDDLMGNSSDLTSSPSPYPIYMGGEYGRLRRKVERAIRGVHDHERLLLEEEESNTNGTSYASNAIPAAINDHKIVLSDKLISDFIRSYRDAHGKRTTPIGLVQTLELLLRELHIPRSSLGAYSYVSLLTCCKSPLEARKVNEMRKEDGVRSNAYFWSAFVDVYARSGDYRGAEIVLDEMLEETKMEYETWGEKNNAKRGSIHQKVEKPIAIPPLPAYTSFFSACYKLISRVDVHPSIKADASNRAWTRWKEMRIHSVAPDVMAYGALMRIFAAQGRAEKALDLLEEIMMQLSMPVSAENVLNGTGEVLRSLDGDEDGWYDDRDGKTVRVKPTTLLFTSALRAVAKSHEVALRFSGGASKKNRKRESVTSYHGRLARKIVILAEQAEVEQDDGFVAALMLCAATAGDSSTCRAIFLGSKIRRMDHLRTCGGKDHMKRLQGLVPKEPDLIGTDSLLPSTTGQAHKSPALLSIEEEFVENHKAYEYREYGTDTRILSALLLAHAKAMEPKGLGSIWAGKYNRGYLCENSLRWIEAYNIPQKANMAIPGISSVDAGLTPEGWEAESFEDDDRDSKQLRKKHKFNIKKILDDGFGNRIDELDSFFDGFDPHPEEIITNDGTENEVVRDWLIGNDIEHNALKLSARSQDEGDEDDEDDEDDDDDGITTMEYHPSLSSSMNDKIDGSSVDDDSDSEDETEFDNDDSDEQDALIQALTRTKVTVDPKLANTFVPSSEEEDGDLNPNDYFDDEEFNKFIEDTMQGMDDSMGEAEELKKIPGLASNDFAAFKAHLRAEVAAEGSTHDVKEEESRQLFDMMRTYLEDDNDNLSSAIESVKPNPSEQPIPEAKRSWETIKLPNKTMYADDYIEWTDLQDEQAQSLDIASETPTDISNIGQSKTVDTTDAQQMLLSQLHQDNFHISELKQALPGMPVSRLEKLSEEFERVLSYPSVLRLSVAVRENMPDAFSPQCLVRKNLVDAKFVFSQAASEGLVDIHLLNGMLQVQANAGRIEPALRFYDTQFAKHGVMPTTHSDRLVIEMLVKKKRLSRAFKLKHDIEKQGRNLDLLSYGTLVEHYSKKCELGSALLLIKECMDIHGSPPGEKSLKNVRELCRKRNLTKQLRLEQMLGKDPLEWIRHGEPLSKGKRSGSNLMYGMNRFVDI